MKRASLSNLNIVPEEMIIYCASSTDLEENNNFKKLLNNAHELRLAGLTPIYLCNYSLQEVTVTSYENLKKQLH